MKTRGRSAKWPGTLLGLCAEAGETFRQIAVATRSHTTYLHDLVACEPLVGTAAGDVSERLSTADGSFEIAALASGR